MYINKISYNTPLSFKQTSNPPQNKTLPISNGKENSHKKSAILALSTLSLVSLGTLLYLRKGKIKPNSGRVTTPTIAPSPKPQVLSEALPKIDLSKFEGYINPEIPVNNSDYQFLLRNPKGFYLVNGKEVNKFLRSGRFEELPEIQPDYPEDLKKVVQQMIEEKRDFNRTVIESIEKINAEMTSVTTEPMTVYRDVPRSWLSTAKDGILTDSAFLSVSTERGASLEGQLSNGVNNVTCEIRLKPGVKFMDLRYTQEKEMLLPPGQRLRVLSPGVLELL